MPLSWAVLSFDTKVIGPLVVGRAADGMIVSSRRRLLAYLRAGDGDAVALELERHLRGLLSMGRLAQRAGSER